MQNNQNTHRSLEKALAILLSFTPNNRQKGVVELSKELGLHVSTASRLTQVLSHHGFLRYDSWAKKYSLGKSAFDLGRATLQSVRGQLVTIAQPYIDELRDSLGEDVALEVLLDKFTILAYIAWGPQPFKVRFSIGDRLPAHVAAGAKAIMAFSPPEFADNLLKGKLIRLTPKTITNPKVLKKKLTQFRQQGVAFDLGESDMDHHIVAAPVFNYEKRPVAAVVTGGFAHKIKGRFEPHIISALKETAAKISSRLFYSEKEE
jgi:IclR family acetate operon transcriptional repressor